MQFEVFWCLELMHFRAVFGRKKGDFEANVARGGGVAGRLWLDGDTSVQRHTGTTAEGAPARVPVPLRAGASEGRYHFGRGGFMAESRTAKRTQRAVDAYRDLRRAVAKLAVLHDNQLRGFELTATQFALLEALLCDGPATLTEIAGKILCTQSNATVVAGNCARRGWIALRDHESDRRKLKAHLTPEGRRLIARVFPLYAKMVRAQMCALSFAQQEVLSRLCQKLEEGDVLRFVLEITRGDWGDEEYEEDEDEEG